MNRIRITVDNTPVIEFSAAFDGEESSLILILEEIVRMLKADNVVDTELF